jgi:hypothetical protein
MAAGRDFMGWKGHREARVLYIDVEMARELLAETLRLSAAVLCPTASTSSATILTPANSLCVVGLSRCRYSRFLRKLEVILTNWSQLDPHLIRSSDIRSIGSSTVFSALVLIEVRFGRNMGSKKRPEQYFTAALTLNHNDRMSEILIPVHP